jgi:hypothetical protein
MRDVTFWVARRIFDTRSTLVYAGNSGDTLFHWVQTFWLLVVAVTATAIWSVVARRQEYVAAHKWFRLFVRFALAAQMFHFGMTKVIPTQFQPPSLATLVEPVGHLAPSGLLWTFMGASPAYQMFTGWAEMLAGVLLLVPRTTTLGALVCLADMIQVFVLNMTYDVGLKQISFHLILMSAFLIAPDTGRLGNFFVRDRPVAPSAQPALFRTARANRVALGLQIAFGIFLLANYTRIARSYWYGEGEPGGPRSPLYGIWTVREMSVDGQIRSPELNDYDRRWRRVIFDTASRMAFQRTDDSVAHYDIRVDVAATRVTLRKRHSAVWQADFTFERPSDAELVLDGDMDGKKIHMRLERVELDTFPLLNGGFRWVRPPN